MTIVFACGHRLQSDDTLTPPVCRCGEDRVRDVKIRPPRFRGSVRGPCAAVDALPAMGLDLAPAGALRMKTDG